VKVAHELRLQIRVHQDGFVRAKLCGVEGLDLVILSLPADPYVSSERVRTAFMELASAVVAQLVEEAAPGYGVTSMAIVPPADDPQGVH
jgi:hypothetical protein